MHNQIIIGILILVIIGLASTLGVYIYKKEHYGGYVLGGMNPVYVPTPQECRSCPFSCNPRCPDQNNSNTVPYPTSGNWFPNKVFLGDKTDRSEIYSEDANRCGCNNNFEGC